MISAWLVSALSFGQEPAPETPETPAPEAPPVEPATLTPVPIEPDALPVESQPVEALPVETQPVEAPVETQPVEPPSEPERGKPLPFAFNIEYGRLNNSEPAFDLLSERNGMRSFGLTAGVRLAPNLVAVGGWHQVRQGADLWVSGTETDADFQNEQLVFRNSIVANEITLGARADMPVEDIFFPFVSAQGMLMTSLVRIDDDLEDRQNATQFRESAMHMGGLFTGGGELRLPPEAPAQLALSMEYGYSWLSRATLGDLGEMKPGGFAFRLGAGVRF